MPSPYSSAARDYFAAGWSPLPIRPGDKKPAVSGYHGLSAPMATSEDVERFCAAHGALNVALRLPDGIVGIDVDNYDDKAGAAQLAGLEERLGALPWSPISTSRDTSSGIRFYRVADGLRTRGKVADDVDVIAHGIRYAVAAPSVHPEGRVYTWRDPMTGEEIPAPSIADLPLLPAPWVDYLTSSRSETADVEERLHGLQDGPMAPEVAAAVETYRGLVERGEAGRRDALEVTRLLASAMAEGLVGVPTAYAEALALHEEHRPGEVADFHKMLGDAVAYFDSRETYADGAALAFGEIPAADDLEERFWSARPELETVRDFARSRLMPPWMVLGGVLCNVASTVPPTFRLPPIVGAEASLNLMVALVGGSSGGKSASMALAEEVLGYRPEAPSVNPGTGEGLVRQYVETRTEKGEDGVSRTESVQIAEAVRFVVDEIDTLAAIGKGRSGATLLPILRSAWSGSSLGFATASRESRVRVEAHSYRFTLIAGVQPRRADWLVGEEADGGTPQRFLWLPGDDHGARLGVQTPSPLGWEPVKVGEAVRHMKVPDVVRDHTQDLRLRQLQGATGDALDGHANLVRIKVAAALAFLARRFTMNEEDWHLAGLLMEVSTRTRVGVIGEIRTAAEEANRKGAVARGVGDALASEARDDLMVKRAASSIRARLGGGAAMKRGDLRRALRSPLRPYFDEAIGTLVVAGVVEEIAGERVPSFRALAA